jgi:trehalose synthase
MSEQEAGYAPLEEFEPQFTLAPEEYAPFVGEAKIEELKRLAGPVEGKGWANVNSTLIGGGVAEMLQSVVPLARSLGINAKWYVIRGHDEFFGVTKKFHNMLQGLDYPITLEEIFGAYLDTIDENAKGAFIASDLVVVHDPQPAAMVMNGVIFGNVLWRCHIDTSTPHKTVWRFLLPYINQCAGAIFTMKKFVGPGLQIPLYEVSPCIDPLAKKNHQYKKEEALDILAPLFNEHDVDPERPIIAAVSRYDVHKNQASILDAFKLLREKTSLDPMPYLIFLGNTATDDPEGGAMLAELKEGAGDDPDVRFWVNVEDNDRVVGSLMHLADCFVHVSTREGFGLVVSEALWQGTPVIGSRVGGITKQVLDGENGFLVEPLDTEAIAKNLAWFMDNPDGAARLGERGREHVRENFLLPELVRRYLTLLRFYTGQESHAPDFRLNELTYTEVLSVVRPQHPLLSGT